MQDLSYEERIIVTKSIMRLLDEWNVGADEAVSLLGLPATTRKRQLEQYRRDTPFPEDRQVLERMEHLAGIAEALRTTYPRNFQMRNLWIHRPHRRFNNRSPLAAMIDEGLSGLVAVRADLDCSFAWEQSGS